MSETAENSTVESEEVDEESTEQENDTSEESDEFDPERAKAKIRKSNREAENLRKRLKELEPIAEEYTQWKDSQRSESDKLTDRASKAEARVKELESSMLRIEIAQERGLTAAQARRLTGTTREEMEADADDLLELFGQTDKSKPKVTKPSKLSGGSNPTEGTDETDPQKLADLINKARGH